MKLIALLLFIGIGCHTSKRAESLKEKTPQVPVITFKKQTLELGRVRKGESRELVYEFSNTGTSPLVIELVTSCKCTTLEWPRKAIEPGASGTIHVVYDSSDQQLGPLKKTIDIIANTDPIVVEAFFNVEVIP